MPLSVSAPGKLMLLGEHAVVYGRPCLVTAVGQRMHLKLESIAEPVLMLDAPDVGVSGYRKNLADLGTGEIPKGARFIEHGVGLFLKKVSIKAGIRLSTRSEFSSLFGFGSSSASTVCVMKALAQLHAPHLSSFDIFQLAYQTVLDVQKKGSGFDVAAAVYGGTLRYGSGGAVLEEMTVTDIPLIIGYTGVKADTVQIVDEVKALSERNPGLVEGVYDSIGTLVDRATDPLRHEDWKTVGKLCTDNHVLLQKLGVSSEKLDAMVAAACGAGAYGAKLSGAGRGDCMIALADDAHREAVEKAIESAGGQVIRIPANVPGVSISSL